MMSGEERLVYMANQIARNFAAQGEAVAIRSTADHIASFWDPRMKRIVRERAAAPDPGLDRIAAAAIALLASRGAPAHQSAATEFNRVDEVGRSDAG